MVAGMVSNVGVGAGAAAVGAVLRSQWFTCTCNPHSTELTNGFHADCQNCSKATGLLKHNQKVTFNNAMPDPLYIILNECFSHILSVVGTISGGIFTRVIYIDLAKVLAAFSNVTSLVITLSTFDVLLSRRTDWTQ